MSSAILGSLKTTIRSMHQHTSSFSLGETARLKFQLEQALIQLKEQQFKIILLEFEVKELKKEKKLCEKEHFIKKYFIR